ncbi:four helix bundle protein [Patescibacteria group bacterium]|nr:four helix bundle protein [Patescibacteria group bacterium]MBU1921895.1 four helix bundle protein [Patescibacteria group bacterium]
MEKIKIQSYKNLIVWQKAMDLVDEVYKLTKRFPKSEFYVLTPQMRRSAISIPSNIAEGSRRGSRKHYIQFLMIAFGSGAELETQIEIAKRRRFDEKLNFDKADNLLLEVMKILNKMIFTLRAQN